MSATKPEFVDGEDDKFLRQTVQDYKNDTEDLADLKQYIQDIVYDFEGEHGILSDDETESVKPYIESLMEELYQNELGK